MNSQKNPWEELKGQNYFEKDKEIIDEHNASLGPHPLFIDLDLLPEPYIGNNIANVVILFKNQGLRKGVDAEREDYNNYNLVTAIRNNLTHSNKEYPYYYLNPEFKETGGGKWIRQRMKDLIDDPRIGDKTLSERIFAIQLHPYHSARFKNIEGLEGQTYSMHLLSKAINRGALIIFTRTQKEWDDAYYKFDSKFKELKQIPELNFIELKNTANKTPRSPYFKESMGKENFEKLIAAILKPVDRNGME